MPIPASQIFEFLGRHESWNIERHEIASAAFGSLRRSLRGIAVKFGNSDDQVALDILDELSGVVIGMAYCSTALRPIVAR